MAKIANISVGGQNPVRIMGILNTSPESFYKKSIITSRTKIKNAVIQMENDGADFIDVGGMSTAPYLSTMVFEKIESKRVLDAIKIIQNTTPPVRFVFLLTKFKIFSLIKKKIYLMTHLKKIFYKKNKPNSYTQKRTFFWESH